MVSAVQMQMEERPLRSDAAVTDVPKSPGMAAFGTCPDPSCRTA